jgi:methyl-accepting chemotaxis protein
MQQLDSTIQSNASAADELASTAEELSGQAVQLQEAVGFFRLSNQRSARTVGASISVGRKAAARPPRAERGGSRKVPKESTSRVVAAKSGGISLDLERGDVTDVRDDEFEAA